MEETTSYIEILIDSLKQKKAVLIKIKEENHKQADIANKEDFKLEEFEDTITQKDSLIKQIGVIDDGFNIVYDRIRNTLIKEKDKYKDKIIELKHLVSEIAELSVSIQVEEQKNKSAIERKLSSYKKHIKQFKTSKKTATSYYKNMNNQSDSQSYFVDKKN
ncbi:hypothetical protein EDC18_107117 [Natranaerovirga pectinivora]|uniref:FlgN protein n=1 Tax=Natranaerovirga pectinivora TaxID=682400 RepID=A0A4R3MPD5_9FIRM|nr:hypothetical protein [Natranaerovirga pectinivora]TCT14048.1 hypothetical protein EDC18_107117 [Natranaerovirga pectinivora]